MGYALGRYKKLKRGDFVSRDGKDVHLVLNVYEDCMHVVCLKNSDWCEKGFIEYNLIRRYTKLWRKGLTDLLYEFLTEIQDKKVEVK